MLWHLHEFTWDFPMGDARLVNCLISIMAQRQQLVRRDHQPTASNFDVAWGGSAVLGPVVSKKALYSTKHPATQSPMTLGDTNVTTWVWTNKGGHKPDYEITALRVTADKAGPCPPHYVKLNSPFLLGYLWPCPAPNSPCSACPSARERDLLRVENWEMWDLASSGMYPVFTDPDKDASIKSW